jgi:hypothetical protein
VICPLFVWTKGHHKRGSRDVLVLEERILLLLTTYAPNLWRVFLTYAHDAVGKVRGGLCRCAVLLTSEYGMPTFAFMVHCFRLQCFSGGATKHATRSINVLMVSSVRSSYRCRKSTACSQNRRRPTSEVWVSSQLIICRA